MRAGPIAKLFCFLAITLVGLGMAGCENGTGPGTTRFGQIGEIRVHVKTPEGPGDGLLEQVIEWESEGPWRIIERVFYRGRLGDENVQRLRIDLDTYAANYATAIAQLNENEGLKLFHDSLDPGRDPNCAVGRTEVLVIIRDDVRNEQQSWARCTFGSLADLQIGGAGPDAAAGRVPQAAVLVRDLTIGSAFSSAFRGTVPYATIERGGESGADMSQPRVIRNQLGWDQFWEQHRGPGAEPPGVNFSADQVIVGARGARFEAGDSIEVRQILQIEGGTVTQLVERGPGDFCSPAAQTQTPYHIVIAPKTALPMSFVDLAIERVPCG